MNNKPVAWMCPTGLEYKQRATDFMYNDALYDTKLNWIPLYTHPANACKHGVDDGACKECYLESTHTAGLTDEEIAEVYEKCEWSSGYVYWKEFARAILRKAQSNCNGFCGEYECKENKGGCKRNEPTAVSYTHPVKEYFEDEPQAEELHEIMQSSVELTDEEILAISNENYIENKGGDIEFARAILRKAQEK